MAVPRQYRPLIARYGGGKFDKWARRTYGITGYGLLARQIQAESGWKHAPNDPSNISYAHAKGLTQFIPSTRRAFIRQFGIDPWKDEASAVRAEKIHLTHYGGLRGYNPGMPSYTDLVLGQNVGNVRKMLRQTGHLTADNKYTGKSLNRLEAQGGSWKGTPQVPIGGRPRGRQPAATPAAAAPKLSDLLVQTPAPNIPVPAGGLRSGTVDGRSYLPLPQVAGLDTGGPLTNGKQGQTIDLGAALRAGATMAPQQPTLSRLPGGGLVDWGSAPNDSSHPSLITRPVRKGHPTRLNPNRFQVAPKNRFMAVRRTDGAVALWNGRMWVWSRSGQPLTSQGTRGGGGRPGLYHGHGGGTTLGAPNDRAGQGTLPVVRHFVEALADAYGKPITYGTGTNHNRMTTSGNVSDHWDGHAIDLPATGARLYHMGVKALRLLGVSREDARRMGAAGGIFNIPYKGRRYQVIFRTNEGGNHWNHLHVGIR